MHVLVVTMYLRSFSDNFGTQTQDFGLGTGLACAVGMEFNRHLLKNL